MQRSTLPFWSTEEIILGHDRPKYLNSLFSIVKFEAAWKYVYTSYIKKDITGF